MLRVAGPLSILLPEPPVASSYHRSPAWRGEKSKVGGRAGWAGQACNLFSWLASHLHHAWLDLIFS